MYTIGATGADSGTEILWILSISESVIIFLVLWWQLLFASEDFDLFAPAAPVLPILTREVRQWFSRRYWTSKLLRFFARVNHRYFLPLARSADFLLLRDGWLGVGFLKTPARNDIPPPVLA